jgi:hypothetical protein
VGQLGDGVRDGELLPHDLDAIRAAYGGEDVTFAAYCEIEDVESYADCRENDIGTDSIAGAWWAFEDRMREMACRTRRSTR